jgi:type I restriction enzyme S subunit
VLEEMARAIYREWFVYFRYPGHENVVDFDSEAGLIPEGWRRTPFGEVAAAEKGLPYKGAYLTEDGTPMANLKCFRPGGGFRRDGTKPYSGPFKAKHEVRPGDLVVANTDLTQAGSVIGSPAIVPRRGFQSGGIISHHLFAIRCVDPAQRIYLYEALRDQAFRDYARSVASGTTVLGLRPADLHAYQLLLPPADLVARFAEFAVDIAARCTTKTASPSSNWSTTTSPTNLPTCSRTQSWTRTPKGNSHGASASSTCC